MITADTAAVSESQLVYSNFEQEVNFCHDQNWYEHVIRNWSQSFYSAWAYYIMKNLISDDENIYDEESDSAQNNQNHDSDQNESE